MKTKPSLPSLPSVKSFSPEAILARKTKRAQRTGSISRGFFGATRGKHTLRTLQEDQWPWSKQTFPHQTIASNIAHLRKEILELEVELDAGHNAEAIIELADIQLLVVNLMSLLSVSAEAHIENCYTKLAINKERVWAKPGADGVVEHVRDCNHRREEVAD